MKTTWQAEHDEADFKDQNGKTANNDENDEHEDNY